MTEIKHSPFVGYREEQIGLKLTDYFVQPDFFNELEDTAVKFIYGSRGMGKTTLLKALTLDRAASRKDYINSRPYIGVYYRIDLNVSSAFNNEGIKEDQWYKLYSYYFVCNLSLSLFNQIDLIKNELELDETEICKEVAFIFGFSLKNYNFENVKYSLRNEVYTIERYVNNIPLKDFPEIGLYAHILGEIPSIIFKHSSLDNADSRFVIYLIDEFEALSEYQQKAVISLIKYADKCHTYKIGLRPHGLKVKDMSTVGGEYVRESDDFSTIILDAHNYNDLAQKVCDKRLEIFYKENFPNITDVPTINTFLDDDENYNEIEDLFSEKSKQEKHEKKVIDLLSAFDINDKEIIGYYFNHHEDFYLYELNLIKHARKAAITPDIALEISKKFKKKDKSLSDFINNYKIAIDFYIVRLYSREKNYSGFQTIVNLSGNTLRYLLEMCNEIFSHAYIEDKNLYLNPKGISPKIQSKEVREVSTRRLYQIKDIPGFGPTMRMFIRSFGNICSIYHEDSAIRIWEPNHFSIKADSSGDEDVEAFLKECVFRGVLRQFENNKMKDKNRISLDQYIYQIHPIYTPILNISWRKKQKIELKVSDIRILISGDVRSINNLLNEYVKKTLSTKTEDIVNYIKKKKVPDSSDVTQLSFFDINGDME